MRQEFQDACAIAKKLLDHYRPEGLDQFTDKKHGTFEPLLKTGVLTEKDGRTIDGLGLEYFTFRRSAAFSRQYEFSFDYSPGRSPNTSERVILNHRGEPIWEPEEVDVSSDLPADVTAMWAVDHEGRSPTEAIPIASRVFNTVQLIGLRRDQIVALVGDHHSRRPDGKYNSPFWPPDPGDLVYRFDTGSYGWQFNVKLDGAGICTGVERLWIH
ncbi:hypothetical protein FRUB_07617 [Fimbriiglobus ruber]|uniref:Uncharacterized protein n=1 Tax=Fimbriiglobus ruber TaxID=1908690 RepID=A0A225DQP5_9BACT|nr:hypothetical protein FRUB_07617 [Fimbriiglobus ruber]